MEINQTLLQQARQHILNLYNHKHDARLTYHNYAQVEMIVKKTGDLAAQLQAPEPAKEIALLAAYFHQTGYLENYPSPEWWSVEKAKEFLESVQYPHIAQVLLTIQNIHRKKIQTAPEAIVWDAIQFVCFTDDYNEQSALLRLELELTQQQVFQKTAWQEEQVKQLLQVQFFTPYGKVHYAPKVSQNIIKQKNKIEKGEKETTHSSQPALFAGLDAEGTSRGAQTFFKSNYRNHINLSAIADVKANIMISVNSILISILITILTWRNITETQPNIILPSVIFLMTGMTSLIFAVLSARPKVTNLNKDVSDINIIRKNVAFFGNFADLSLGQYEQAMDELLRDEALLYGNMSRDMYYLGKVLSRKYRYLILSYNVFMVGFVLAVALFLILLFL